MSIITLLEALWQFIKRYFFIILLGAIIFAALLGGWRFYKGQKSFTDEQESYETLVHVYEQEPASFQMIFMTEEGNLFTNSFLFDEYFETEDVLHQVEAMSGVNIERTLQAEHDLELYKTSFFRGGIAAIQNKSSGIITFRFLVGEEAEENLAVAEAYYELILRGELPFISNMESYLIKKPTLGEIERPDELPALASVEILNPYAKLSKKSLIIYSFLGFIFGAFLTGFVLLLKRLLADKIEYPFEYSWAFSDAHYVVTQQHALETIEAQLEAAVVEEGKALPELKDREVLLVVEAGQTSKKWYRESYSLAQALAKHVTIVHVGKE